MSALIAARLSLSIKERIFVERKLYFSGGTSLAHALLYCFPLDDVALHFLGVHLLHLWHAITSADSPFPESEFTVAIHTLRVPAKRTFLLERARLPFNLHEAL